jgi:lysozyme family protein
MSSVFDQAFEHTIGIEGGYSNNPSDPGGETMYGVTARVARRYGYLGAMRDLPLDRAKDIAKLEYWDVLRLDQIANVAPGVASELFDTGYNCGTGTSARFLQRALNKFNRRQKDYPDTTEDGSIGVGTLSCLFAFLQKRGDLGRTVLARALNALQGAYYFNIADTKPELEDFEFGWFATRVGSLT